MTTVENEGNSVYLTVGTGFVFPGEDDYCSVVNAYIVESRTPVYLSLDPFSRILEKE